MLSPGVAPIQTGQQNAFIITGGISPAVNGLRAQMNDFTLDGIENNQRFSNSYAVSPPPDAIAEFKVASHQTGADVSLAAGANVARVANPAKLKAEIKVAETQAKDITFDQKAYVDTRNGVIPGHVVRIDPSAQNGTRTVDVALDGPLPKGAVPDLSVDGTIEIERLDDVMYVGRPVQAQSESAISLFKIIDGGKEAVRVPVKLGRTSVSTIVVLDGLQVGDQVILSDMSAYDAYSRVRLK